MDRFVKKAVAVFLAAVMLLSTAPVAGLDLWFGNSAVSAVDEIKADYVIGSDDSIDTYHDETSDLLQDSSYTEGLRFQKTKNGETGEVYYSVYSYNGTADEIVIPDYYNGYPVKVINSRVFDSANMRSIRLPNQLTQIGGYAFHNCRKLEFIEFPESMLSLYGGSAFFGCTSLKKISFGNQLTSISDQAFIDCTSLEEVYLPDSVTSIGMSAFMRCIKLKQVYGGKCLTSISSQAFSGCYALESFVVGDNVEKIGINAFSNCNSLKSVSMGKSLKNIDSSAFAACSSLESLYFNPGLETIGTGAFRGCYGLKKLYIPSSVTNINDYAFYGCDSLKDVYYSGDQNNYNLIEINYDHNDVFCTANLHYNYSCNHDSITESPSQSATCTEAGYTAKKQCNDCGMILVEKVAIPPTGHNLYWHHTDYMGNSAYDLVCSKCKKNYGRGYLDSDNFYYMFAYTDNGVFYHYYYSSDGKKLGEDKCNISSWTSDEQYHTGICKCHLILCEDEEHQFDNIESNDDYHWYECGICRMTAEKELHSGGTATCTKKAKCTACGKEYGKPLSHKYESIWTTDSTNHWQKCSFCGKRKNMAAHFIKSTVSPATLLSDGKITTGCSICGKTSSNKTIAKIATVTLSSTKYAYNGKVQKPAVSVKDSSGKALKIGTDYTVEYSGGCQSSGTYTVTVKFKGNYSGTQKLTYRIVLNAPAELKATRQKASYITLSWSKVSGATGYSVYQYNAKTKKYEKVASSKGNTATVKNLKAGKSYSFKVVALGKDNSLNSAFSKKITVGTSPVAPILKAKSATKTAGLIWKKISGANSYTVYYSTKKNGTYKKLKTVKGNSYTAKKPIAGKTYYYKVVATAKIAGRTLTSGYSNIVKG